MYGGPSIVFLFFLLSSAFVTPVLRSTLGVTAQIDPSNKDDMCSTVLFLLSVVN